MIEDFNLLATTYRHLERSARTEMTRLLRQIGDLSPIAERTGISGLIALKTMLDPLEVIGKFRAILRERPYEFHYTLRVLPVERVVPTNLDEIQTAALRLAGKIGENESFRITVEKRFSSLHSQEIVDAVAEGIKRKVNLKQPDKVLLIEIVGKWTGLSVIEPSGSLSVLKEKLM